MADGAKSKKFTGEFSAETVKQIRESGRTVGSVAREFGLEEASVRSRVRQVEALVSANPLIPDEGAARRGAHRLTA